MTKTDKRFTKQTMSFSYLPGQGISLQVLVSTELPLHDIPTLDGEGLLHSLDRPWLPSPQVAEQVDQPDQLLHPPSTTVYNSYRSLC